MKRISMKLGLLFMCLTLIQARPDVSHLSGVNSGNNDGFGDLRSSIPGEPEKDYPIFSQPPETSFTCAGKEHGYYADVEARCQVFRICADTDLTGKGFKFLCPNGTLFNQEFFVCDWHNHVDCSKSESLYGMNAGKQVGGIPEMMKMVKKMMDYPMQGPNGNKPVSGQGFAVSNNPGTQTPVGNSGFNPTKPGPVTPFNGNGNGNKNQNSNANGKVNGNSPQGINNGLNRPINDVLSGPGNTNGNGNRLEQTSNGNKNSNVQPVQNGGSPNNVGVSQLSVGPGRGEVYINKLGQLSTDPDSGFNPQTATYVKTDTTSLQSTNIQPQSQKPEDRIDYLPPFTSDGQPELPIDVRFNSEQSSNTIPQNRPDNRYNQAQLLQENFPNAQSNGNQKQPQQQQHQQHSNGGRVQFDGLNVGSFQQPQQNNPGSPQNGNQRPQQQTQSGYPRQQPQQVQQPQQQVQQPQQQVQPPHQQFQQQIQQSQQQFQQPQQQFQQPQQQVTSTNNGGSQTNQQQGFNQKTGYPKQQPQRPFYSGSKPQQQPQQNTYTKVQPGLPRKTSAEIVPSIELGHWSIVSGNNINNNNNNGGVIQRQGHSISGSTNQHNYHTQQFQAAGSTHQQVYTSPTFQRPTFKNPNEQVVVKVIPTHSYNLNDPIDRELLNNIISQVGSSHEHDVYANAIQKNGQPQIIKLREQPQQQQFSNTNSNLFSGHSSYNVPFNSVGQLPCDGNGYTANRSGCK